MSKEEAVLLLVICGGAFIMPYISRRLMLPLAVGEIVYGLFLGIFFRENLAQSPVVRFLGEFGFIVLMYLAGLEINFRKIRTISRLDLGLFFGMFLVIGLFSYGAMNYQQQPPIYMLVYLMTAVGMLFPILKETGIVESDTGQAMLIIGSIGELVSLIALTVFLIYFKFGFSTDALIHIVEIGLFLLAALTLHRALRLLVWWFPGLSGSFMNTGDSAASGIRANFVNLFVFVALAALLDLELIVGAFLGGIVFAIIFKDREHIQERIGSFGYGFLIPIFFIEVGMEFDVRLLTDMNVLKSALLLTGLILVIRVVAGLVLLFSGLSLREIVLVPFATSFALTLLVAAAKIGRELELLDHVQFSAVLLTAVISALVYPAILKLMLRRAFP